MRVVSGVVVMGLLALCSGCGGRSLPIEPEVTEEDSAPAWSPDSQSIAFVHFNPNPADTSRPIGVYVIPVRGGPRRLVVSRLARSVDWSPDSRRLVFNDDYGLHVVTATGESLRTVYTGGSYPSWSPDGAEIAFSTTRATYAIHPDGTGLRQVSPSDLVGIVDCDWAPDGGRMVALGPSAGVGEEVLTFSLRDSTRTWLTSDANGDRSPVWSPEGGRIAWSRLPEVNGRVQLEIWVMNEDGSGKRRVVGRGLMPDWDPTGTWLVYSAWDATGAERLFVVRHAGTGLRQLTDCAAAARDSEVASCSWSDRGNKRIENLRNAW
jgi:Tol biopolymer transport system component